MWFEQIFIHFYWILFVGVVSISSYFLLFPSRNRRSCNSIEVETKESPCEEQKLEPPKKPRKITPHCGLRIANVLHPSAELVCPNSPEPFVFENELFKGRLLFLVRTEDDSTNPWAHLFQGKRRKFWVQLQGQFKRQPKGVVYMGGEVPDCMKLGFFTNSLTRVLLRIIRTLVPGLHYSFGTNKKELPHLCFPLCEAVDEFVVTSAGDDPPTLGQLTLGETMDEREGRRKMRSKKYFRYNTQDTYSFQFHSFFIDFTKWKIVNVPGFGDMELSSFWGDMPLYVCAYEVDSSTEGNVENEQKKRHYIQSKHYFFNFELKPITQTHSLSYFEEEKNPLNKLALVDEVNENQGDTKVQSTMTFPFQVTVPMWCEYFNNAKYKRRVSFLFSLQKIESQDENNTFATEQTDTPYTVLIDSSNLRSICYPSITLYQESKTNRFEQINCHRKEISVVVNDAKARFGDVLNKIFQKNSQFNLLNASSPSSLLGRQCAEDFGVYLMSKYRQDMLLEGEVLRVVWNYHLQNEWLVLKKDALECYRSMENKSCYVIKTSEIRSVHCIEVPRTATPFFTLSIETVRSVVSVLVKSDTIRQQWFSTIQGIITQNLREGFASEICIDYAVTAKKKILNIRQQSSYVTGDFNISARQSPPTQVSENLLDSILSFSSTRNKSDLFRFLNLAADLQHLSISSIANLSSEQKACFWLNIYHTMIQHANYYSMLPNSKTAWPSFYKNTCYRFGGRYNPEEGEEEVILSLVEIEHFLLRRKMNFPKVGLFKLLLSKSANRQILYDKLGLQHADNRINFAINHMSCSQLQCVCIYKPQFLDAQLNQSCEELLMSCLQINLLKKTAFLPKVCEWYIEDFDNKRRLTYLLRHIKQYLSGEKRVEIESILSATESNRLIHIKFLPYDNCYHNSLQKALW